MLVESFSGIRGIYGSDLTEEIVAKYAKSFLKFISKKVANPKIVIGSDTRASGHFLVNAFIENLNKAEVINIGVLPTPIVQNAVRAFNADAGIIVTASHNPAEHNGFKLLDNTGASLKDSDMAEVIKATHSSENSVESKVLYKHKEAIEHYKKFIRDILKNPVFEGTKIIVDPNGGAGVVNKSILEDYNLNPIYVNMKKGEFKRAIRPEKESLLFVKKQLGDLDAEFLAGFDCDADRLEILLKNNKIVSGNHLLAIITDYVLSKSEDPEMQTVVVNEATSYVVKEIVQKYNANFKESEVGESKVVEEMRKNNSLIGGEGPAGGIILSPSTCRDGVLTLLYILKIVTEKGVSLEELLDRLPIYYYLEKNLEISNDFLIIKPKLKQHYLNKGFRIIETGTDKENLKCINPIDDSWVLIRPSKTEGTLLRVMVDSKDEMKSNELLNEAQELVMN